MEGMVLSDILRHTVVAIAGSNMVEVQITLTHDGLPDQKLGGQQIRQLVGILFVLGIPGGTDLAGVAVLEDTANDDADLLAGKGVVQVIRDGVPEIVATTHEAVAGVLNHTGFDAVTDGAGVGFHSPDDVLAGFAGLPAVAVLEGGMAPGGVVVIVALTGELDVADFRPLLGGVDGGDAAAQEGRQAQHQSQKHGSGSLDGGFHVVFSFRV